jgi:hypothetical protein
MRFLCCGKCGAILQKIYNGSIQKETHVRRLTRIKPKLALGYKVDIFYPLKLFFERISGNFYPTCPAFPKRKNVGISTNSYNSNKYKNLIIITTMWHNPCCV